MSSVASPYHSDHDDDLVSRAESLALSDIASSEDESSVASFPVRDLNPSISVSELKKQMAPLLRSKGQDLVQACRNYDRRSTGKIQKSQLRQVVRMFCLPLSTAQFDCLLSELKMNADDKISYRDFFSQLCGTEIPESGQHLPKTVPNHVPIDEIELMIKEKVEKNLRNVIRSFWLFDINGDGLIQKAELRRVIHNYCLRLDDNAFDDFWKRYDSKLTGVLNYRDFLVRLGINADCYKKFVPLRWKDESWEQKCKRAALENRDDPAIQGLPLEEIEHVLLERLQRQRRILQDVFKIFDAEKSGAVSMSDFRGIVNFFVLAMSTSLFNRVLRKLNIDISRDKLDYKKFLDTFCQSSPS